MINGRHSPVNPPEQLDPTGASRPTRLATAALPRVGIVDDETESSGMTRYVRALLDGIDKEAFELVLFCRADGPHRALPPIPGVRVVHLLAQPPRAAAGIAKPGAQTGRGVKHSLRDTAQALWRSAVPQTLKHLVGFLRDARRTQDIFAANPVDLLHVQIVSNSKAVVAGRAAGVPKILGTHHLDPGRTRLHQLMPEILTSRRLDHAIAVSHSTMAAWARRRGMSAAKLSVIPNGVDVGQYRRQFPPATARAALGLPVDEGRVLSVVGRLEEQKGHKYLLEAFAGLLQQVPGTHLAFAGDGTLREPLVEQAKALGIAHHVHFLGHCEGVQTVLDASDVFVLPSLWEAMPFALLEAMAASLPVVATAVAGVPELVVEGETGFLVPPADANALLKALLRTVQMPNTGREMGVAGRQRVERHFSLQTMLFQTENLYRKLLSRVNLNQ
jgi:glycosyltransferase involved in cell wall biosynthesis